MNIASAASSEESAGDGGRGAFWFSVAVVVAIKLYILQSSAGDVLGDYGRLLALADEMLRSSRWLSEGDVDKYALPPAIWKTPGYPLLIAGSKLLLGENWPWGLGILQSIMSFVAGLSVRRFALALGFGPRAAAVAFVMYAFSVPASTDTLIMPDGFYGSIATMVITSLSVRFLCGTVLSLRAALGAGLAIMACFWVREGFAFLVLPFGLALVAPFWLGGMSVRRAAFLLVVFCAPALVSTGAVMVWNKFRTGDYLVAIVSQTVYLITVLKVSEKVPGVFEGSTPLDQVGRTITLKDHDYGDAQAIDEVLFRDYGVRAPELMRLTQAKYWQTVARFPGAFAITMWERLRFRQQASMLGDVLMRLDDLDWWRFVGPQKPYMIGWRANAQKFIETRDFKFLSASVIVNAVPRLILRGVTLVLFTLGTFMLPLIVIRDLWAAKGRDVPRQTIVFGSLYLLYWGIIFIYMLVSLEIRYLSPVCVIPVVGSLWVCGQIASWISRPKL